MIEFSGQMSYETEKHLYKKGRKMFYAAFTVAWGVLLVPIVLLAISSDFLLVIYGYIVYLPIMLFAVWLYQPNKKKPADPVKITVDEEYINYETKQATVYRSVSDAKEVRDYGNFYDVIYPFGNVTTLFVCQKDLLTQGTLEEFEKLFEGKIVNMNQSSE